jgi:dihydrofolate synthase/folylpolyglutamate synthase
MLEDKDQGDSLKALLGEVDLWYPASLAEARGASAEGLAVVLRKLKVAPEQIQLSNDPSIAIERALAQADSIDRIVVFGSFYTVAGALSRLQGRHGLVPAASC